jgi:uncharacterized protein (DUF58 family)
MELTRTALRGLTLRGRCLLSAGVALAVCAVVLGQEDLLRAAIFLLVLPFVAIVVVLRTRYRLSCNRHLDPARVHAGESTDVHLELDNVSRLPSGVMLMEDALPYALGGRPRFVLDRIEPSGVREVSYTVRSDVRGRFRIGPLAVRLTDPFGLCELHRSFSSFDDLVVTPRVDPLPPVRLGGDRSGGGEASVSALTSGTNDTTTREYRYGDDLRRVHWRSTARVGELMVRQEEAPRQERATLMLDTRSAAHQGEGLGSSFEWAVSALASIGVSLSRQGFTLNLATGHPLSAVVPGVPVDESVLLDALAEVHASTEPTVDRLVAQVRQDKHEGVLIAVLGTLSATDADLLSRMTSSGSKIAFVLDAGSWGGRGRPREGSVRDTRATLRSSGWRVVDIRRGTLIAAAWSLVGAPGSGQTAADLAGTW